MPHPAPHPLPNPAAGDAAASCGSEITRQEAGLRIPDAFLAAIARVESAPRAHAQPWPWTINAAGEGRRYPSKTDAVAAARGFLARGITSLDIGCLQVNLQAHPDAFANLETAFDPAANVAYGAGFLRRLYDTLGSWPRAAAAYHSQTPEIGRAYLARVLEAWADPPSEIAPPDPARRPASRKTAPSPTTTQAAPDPRPDPGANPRPARSASLVSAAVTRAGPRGFLLLPPRPSLHPPGSARDLAAYRRFAIPLAALPQDH